MSDRYIPVNTLRHCLQLVEQAMLGRMICFVPASQLACDYGAICFHSVRRP